MIRIYAGDRYNARVYYPRCEECEDRRKPELDDSYVEAVVHWLTAWDKLKDGM